MSGNENLLCDPTINNYIPCTCSNIWIVIISAAELTIFATALTIFIYKNRKNKMQLMTFGLGFALISGFAIFFGQNLADYLSPTNCRKLSLQSDIFIFLSQSLFFLCFFWVIFKLLGVWEMMTNEGEENKNSSARRLLIYQILYIIVWLIIWST